MSVNIRDVAAGALFMALGAAFGVNALYNMPLGTALNMGPGYFPLMLSAVLFALGLIIALRAIGSNPEAWGHTPWRGLLMIPPGLVIFAATVKKLGFIPALVILVLLSAYASERMTSRLAVAIVASLTLFCVVLFNFALGSQFRLIGPWLTY
jgi:hypothetical protein